MDPILDVARQYGLVVIEDATESLGARYRDRMVGRLGDIACFSFNGNKLITTGGGGMIVTDNEAWARNARYLTTQAKDDPIEFVHGAIGYNYRLTNIQAALGCAQLEQLDSHIQAKRRTAARYAAALSDVPGLTLMREAAWASSVFWMFTVLIDAEKYGMDSRGLLRALDTVGIQSRPLWQPLHRSQAHRSVTAGSCEVAERVSRDGLSIPCSVGLDPEDQERVIAELHRLAR
jgi:perosamine synthetase